MKKTVCVVCLIFLCLLPFPHGLEADVSDPPPAIVINGRVVGSDVDPILIDGRTLVPLRLISESFGMEVEWQADSGLIHLTCPSGDWLTFAIGSTEMRSSCGTGQMEIAPLICQGRAMVPLRVIGECFGLEVAWEPDPAGKAGHVILNGNTAAGRLRMPVHLGKSSQGNLLADDKLKHMGFSQTDLAYILQADLTDKEQSLLDALNRHRVSYGLPALTLDMALVKVARTHVVDSMAHHPRHSKDHRCMQGNLHSWSHSPHWSSEAYTKDHAYASMMWDKPRELTGFTGHGFENAYASYGEADPQQAMAAWIESPSHHDVMIGNGDWAGLSKVGVAIDGNYAFMWFAE